MGKLRAKYPKLPEHPAWTAAQLDALDAYLSGVIQQADKAHAAAVYAASIDDIGGWASHNAEYWRHGRAILRWLRGNIRRSRTKGVKRTPAASADTVADA